MIEEKTAAADKLSALWIIDPKTKLLRQLIQKYSPLTQHIEGAIIKSLQTRQEILYKLNLQNLQHLYAKDLYKILTSQRNLHTLDISGCQSLFIPMGTSFLWKNLINHISIQHMVAQQLGADIININAELQGENIKDIKHNSYVKSLNCSYNSNLKSFRIHLESLEVLILKGNKALNNLYISAETLKNLNSLDLTGCDSLAKTRDTSDWIALINACDKRIKLSFPTPSTVVLLILRHCVNKKDKILGNKIIQHGLLKIDFIQDWYEQKNKGAGFAWKDFILFFRLINESNKVGNSTKEPRKLFERPVNKIYESLKAIDKKPRKILLKIPFVGTGYDGKTALINRFKTGAYITQKKSAIQCDFETFKVEVDNLLFDLQIWDIAYRRDFYREPSYIRGADAIVYIKETLHLDDTELDQEILAEENRLMSAHANVVKLWGNALPPIFIIVTKSDLLKVGTPSYQKQMDATKRLAEKIGAVEYYETSAKENLNIKTPFEEITRHAYEYSLKEERRKQYNPPRGFVIAPEPPEQSDIFTYFKNFLPKMSLGTRPSWGKIEEEEYQRLLSFTEDRSQRKIDTSPKIYDELSFCFAIINNDFEKVLFLKNKLELRIHADFMLKMAFEMWDSKSKIIKIMLLDKRFDPGANNHALLYWCIEKDNLEKLNLLLSHHKVNPAYNDNQAICMATEKGLLAMVECLLCDKRVDPSARNNAPLRLALHNGHRTIVNLLLQDPRVRNSYLTPQTFSLHECPPLTTQPPYDSQLPSPFSMNFSCLFGEQALGIPDDLALILTEEIVQTYADSRQESVAKLMPINRSWQRWLTFFKNPLPKDATVHGQSELAKMPAVDTTKQSNDSAPSTFSGIQQ